MDGNPRFQGRTGGKVAPKTRKTVIFPEKSGAIVLILP